MLHEQRKQQLYLLSVQVTAVVPHLILPNWYILVEDTDANPHDTYREDIEITV